MLDLVWNLSALKYNTFCSWFRENKTSKKSRKKEREKESKEGKKKRETRKK